MFLKLEVTIIELTFKERQLILLCLRLSKQDWLHFQKVYVVAGFNTRVVGQNKVASVRNSGKVN